MSFMNTPDAVRPLHLSRLAIVYVRQSSPHQTLANQESLRLQYDLQEHALTAGWEAHRLRVIDSDLGQTGRTTQGRRGFQELVTLVNQEQVGVLFAYDVTRLARNCTDWYQLLDLCGLRQCLVGDQDGIYDPATPNGRMILGLKGLIAELELHTLRSRLTAGLLSKAQRGELAQILPIGLVRDTLGRVSKYPDPEVQTRLSLVFATFLHLKSAPHVVRHFNAHDLLLPRRGYDGDLVWRRPTDPAVLSILKNPAYAGAFVYGRTRVVPHVNDPHKRVHKSLPIEEWKICLKDKYPAYIDWGTFTQIQAMIRDNYSDYDRNQTRGVPRPGKALLQGIVCCGECGHKIVVQYKGKPRYVCNYLQQKYGVPTCQNLPADTIDAHVVQAFFDVLSPAELDLYDKAVSALRQDDEHMQQARQQQLERLRYQVRLAERQFNQADPDNRLVTAELEKRWEAALRELKDAEERFQREQQQPRVPDSLSPEDKEAFLRAGRKLPELWRQGRLQAKQQKAFLRCLIDKVVVHRSAEDTLAVRIVWRGGESTAVSLPVTVNSLAQLSFAEPMEKEILKLAKQGKPDAEIATFLTQQGYRSPKHTTVLASTVRIIRLRHRLLHERRQSHPRRISDRLTVSQLASILGVTLHWIYDRIHNGTIQVSRDQQSNLYLFPDKPETIRQFKQLRAGKLQKLRF
jgi:DNA invertase Pin-like site-specific DNA recombinase